MNLLKALSTVSAMTLLSRILGLVRDFLIARIFGASIATDAFLVGPALSLADLHLGAMLAYFAAAPEGAALLRNHPRLAAWWGRLSRRPSFAATDPGLPNA